MTKLRDSNVAVRFAVGDAAGPLSTEMRSQVAALLHGSTHGLDDACVVAVAEDTIVGVLQVEIGSTCPSEHLGTLPAREAYVQDVAFADGYWGYLPVLVADAGNHIWARHGLDLQWNIKREKPRWEEFRAAALGSGMTLFQEKQGFAWDDANPPTLGPIRFRYETITEVGEDEYRRLLTRCGADSLDRNDAWYRKRAGAENWGHAFMGYYDPAHADTWLVARDSEDQAVGFVAVAPLGTEGTATIIYIGVAPEHRGRGVVDDLLRRGSIAAREAGFPRMLSDADVLNRPMCEAFVRNGHQANLRPWHSWHFRSR